MHLAGSGPRQAALLGAAFLIAALSACGTSASLHSASEISAWAARRGFAQQSIQSERFRLTALVRQATMPSTTLNVYIEGDGAAWPTPWQAPRDPTPTRPLALTLAAALFVPISVIATIFSMNLKSLPFSEHPNGFYAVILFCFVYLIHKGPHNQMTNR